MAPEETRRPEAIGTPAFLGGSVAVKRPPAPPPPPEPRSLRRWLLPAALFAATCLSTWYAGERWMDDGWMYAAGIMTILTAHELGHFFQARRHGVPASPPYFLPMPFSPIGTFGAIIAMRSHVAGTRALFDIAVTGPLAGLVPTVVLLIVGLRGSEVGGFVTEPPWLAGKPLLFQWLETWVLGPDLPALEISYHPLAVAAWTGLFVTALNLIPIGQLDGGHILYTLLRRKAHAVSAALVALAALAIASDFRAYGPWILMLVLLVMMGVRHPPTAHDTPLGRGRAILGWLAIAFVVVGFTPSPFPTR